MGSKRCFVVVGVMLLAATVFADAPSDVDLQASGSGTFMGFSPSFDNIYWSSKGEWFEAVGASGLLESAAFFDSTAFNNANGIAQGFWDQADIDAFEQVMRSAGYDEYEIGLLSEPFYRDPAALGYATAAEAYQAAFMEVFTDIVREQLVSTAAGSSPVSQRVRNARSALYDGVLAFAVPRAMADSVGLRAFYQEGDLGGMDVKSYGASPDYSFEAGEYDVRIGFPVERAEYEFGGFDAELESAGVDATVCRRVSESLSVGVHGNFSDYDYDDDVDGDEFTSYTVGGFVGVRTSLTDSIGLGYGVILDYTRLKGVSGEIDVDKDGLLGGFGANLGIELSDSVVCNPYAIYWQEFDEAEGYDDDFFDIGVELGTAITANWSLNLGAKTSIGYKDRFSGDDYDEYEIYVGSHISF